MNRYSIHFDGSCGPKNPGGTAAYGYVLRKEGEGVIKTGHGVIGSGPAMSNNLAEFFALMQGLDALMGLETFKERVSVSVYGDSKLVINIMNRIWKPSTDKLYFPAYETANKVLKGLRQNGCVVTFDWVPREKNQECDDLSKEHQK